MEVGGSKQDAAQLEFGGRKPGKLKYVPGKTGRPDIIFKNQNGTSNGLVPFRVGDVAV